MGVEEIDLTADGTAAADGLLIPSVGEVGFRIAS